MIRKTSAIALLSWVAIFFVALTGASAAAPPRANTNMSAEPRFWVEELATGLKNPSSMAWLPGGRILIAERNGGLRIFDKGVLSAPLNGVPKSFQNWVNGIKEVVLDREFAHSHTVYLLIAEGDYDAHHAAVWRGTLSGNALLDLHQLWRSKDDIAGPMQIAGRMLQLRDGTLLIGVTDDNYHRQYPQDLTSHIGKMVRINPDGSAPVDNPFKDKTGALPDIWTLGNRVNNGLFEDPQTGEVWGMEPGPKGGDEMNLLKRGQNYGWPIATWGFDYTDGPVGPHQTMPDMESPVVVWTPSGTPAGITRYRGHAFAAWKGDYFIGMLSGKHLERVRLSNGVPVLQERLLLDLEERIRDVRTGPDGFIYLLTDHENGRLLRLVPGVPTANSHIAHKLATPAAMPFEISFGDARKGELAFRDRCAVCHSVGEKLKGGTTGPDLTTIYNRKAGSLPGYAYSTAMARFPQNWNIVSLNLLLADPQHYVPGTTMSSPPVTDRDMRSDIVGYLYSLIQ